MDWGATEAAIVTLALALGGVLFMRRFGGGLALAELQRANRILSRSVRELENKLAKATARIAELEARTDVAVAILPVLDALRSHEVQAETRSIRTLAVLDLIAQRLGPEGPED